MRGYANISTYKFIAKGATMPPALTPEQYIAKAKVKHNNKYDYNITNYTTSRADIDYICPVHGKQTQSAAAHLRSNGCYYCGNENRPSVKRYDKKKFLTMARNRHGDKYNYDKVTYVDQDTPVTITCPEHGDFEQKPVYHVNGKGCPECGKYTSNNTAWTNDKIKQTGTAKYGDKYNYDKVEYHNSKIPVMFHCNEHDIDFTQTINMFLKGPSCPKCSTVKRSLSTDEYISKAILKHNNKYDYSITKYTGANNDIEYICPIHGKVKQRASGHLVYGCDECGHESIRKSNKEFINLANKLHNNKYSYDKTRYTTADKKVIITCKKHGDFKQTARDHIRQSADGKRGPAGCPICASSKAERDMFNYLTKHKAKFVREYKIDGYNYRYDFYLPKYNVLIELDGQQHFEPVMLWGGIEALERTQENDRMKNRLAKDLGYSLIRIKYTEFNNLITYFKMRMTKLFKYRWNGNYFKTFKEICEYYNLPGDTQPNNVYIVLKNLNK